MPKTLSTTSNCLHNWSKPRQPICTAQGVSPYFPPSLKLSDRAHCQISRLLQQEPRMWRHVCPNAEPDCLARKIWHRRYSGANVSAGNQSIKNGYKSRGGQLLLPVSFRRLRIYRNKVRRCTLMYVCNITGLELVLFPRYSLSLAFHSVFLRFF